MGFQVRSSRTETMERVIENEMIVGALIDALKFTQASYYKKIDFHNIKLICSDAFCDFLRANKN